MDNVAAFPTGAATAMTNLLNLTHTTVMIELRRIPQTSTSTQRRWSRRSPGAAA